MATRSVVTSSSVCRSVHPNLRQEVGFRASLQDDLFLIIARRLYCVCGTLFWQTERPLHETDSADSSQSGLFHLLGLLSVLLFLLWFQTNGYDSANEDPGVILKLSGKGVANINPGDSFNIGVQVFISNPSLFSYSFLARVARTCSFWLAALSGAMLPVRLVQSSKIISICLGKIVYNLRYVLWNRA